MERVEETPKKLSYEELEKVAHQMSEQLRMAHAQLQQQHVESLYKRLDYLFKVVENSANFKLKFVNKCTVEIEGLLTIEEPPKEEKTKE